MRQSRKAASPAERLRSATPSTASGTLPSIRQKPPRRARLGGLRRRRESVLSGSYALEGLDAINGIRRLLEIAVADTLSLENSIAHSRTLGSLAQTAARLLEAGELEAQLAAFEIAVSPRRLRR